MWVPIRIPPGVITNGTDYQTKGRWRDANFVRWVEGMMQPVGGWQRVTETALTGRICGMMSFIDSSDRPHIAVGTHSKCYMLEGNNVYDVTPTGFVPGRTVSTAGLGYGALEYDDDLYGTERSGDTSLLLEANFWRFEPWGNIPIAFSLEDGRVWTWDPGDLLTAPDAELTLIANAPIDNRNILVTNERHLMLFGAGGDPVKVQWSDREDFDEWTPSATTRAGDLTLATQGEIRVGLKVGPQILVLTTKDAFVINYVGVPFYYGQEAVGYNCGIVGPRAGTSTLDFAVWMSDSGFFLYNGQVQPLGTEVWDWVFRELHHQQKALVTCGHNLEFTEIWWFFPVNLDQTNTRYVVWNYTTNVWTVGRLDRAHWAGDGVWPHPLAGGSDGHVYEHEIALTQGGLTPRSKPYVESAPFDIEDGERVLYVTRIIPDEDPLGPDALEYTFITKRTPRRADVIRGPFTPNAKGYIDTRFHGGQVALKVQAQTDNDWRLGTLRAKVRRGGER